MNKRLSIAGLAGVVTLAITLARAAAGNGMPVFGAEHFLPTNQSPVAIATGDFNGDGKPDVALADPSSGTIKTVLGAGDGTFYGGSTMVPPAGPRFIAIGNLNPDANLDLVTANTDASTITVLYGSGNGNFTSQTTFSSGRSPVQVVVADLNHDGRADILAATSDGVTIALNNSLGIGSTVSTLNTGPNTTSLAVGDLDGDSVPDLVVSHWIAGGTVDVYRGHGDGTFTFLTSAPAASGPPYSIALADFNRDGKLDLSAIDYGGSNAVEIYPGRGNGTFGSPTDYGTGIGTTSQAVADLNGDRAPDLVVSRPGSGYEVFLNRGDGVLLPQFVIYGVSGGSAAAVALSDLNLDRYPDLIVAANNSGGVSSQLNVLPHRSTMAGWGAGDNGQLGTGAMSNSATPVTVSGFDHLVALAGGYTHSMGLRDDGTVWTWGANQYGQLGTGNFAGTDVPVQVPGVSGIIAISSGSYFSLALKSDGTVWAWGLNLGGELGNGASTPNTPYGVPTAAQVPGLTGVVAIAAGNYHSLALKSDGTVWGWGENYYGQLALGYFGPSPGITTPTKVPGVSGVVGIAGGYLHSVALKGDGTVLTWGYNAWGQLGNGTFSQGVASPVTVIGLSDVISIGAGHGHTMALKGDGTVWVWGAGYDGELGNGNFTTSAPYGLAYATGVQSLSGVVAIAAGGYHNLALKSDGAVWAWGYNGYGEVGNGSSASVATPQVVINIQGGLNVAAGLLHSLALVDRPPTATADSYSTHSGTSLIAPGVLSNDGDPDGDLLSASLVSGPSHGSLALSRDGSFSYTPSAGFSGTDSFTYQAGDGLLKSSPTVVTLSVTNQSPIAQADSYPAFSGVPLGVESTHGVQANDTDPDGDAFQSTVVTPPSHATAFSFQPDGGFTYTAQIGFVGDDSFTYTDTDPYSAVSPPATVTIHVAADTGPPAISLVSVTHTQVLFDVQDSGSGLATITAPALRNCTLQVPTFPAGSTGTVRVTVNKTNLSQSASVTLKATDRAGNSSTYDPVSTELVIPAGDRSVSRTFRGLAATEHFVTLRNESPAVRAVYLQANQSPARRVTLAAGEVRSLDLGKFLPKSNSVTVTAVGPGGAKALITFTDRPTTAGVNSRTSAPDWSP